MHRLLVVRVDFDLRQSPPPYPRHQVVLERIESFDDCIVTVGDIGVPFGVVEHAGLHTKINCLLIGAHIALRTDHDDVVFDIGLARCHTLCGIVVLAIKQPDF